MYKRARQGISYLPQEPSIFRKLSVEENIRSILETLRLTEDEEEARLDQLLDELKVAHLRHNPAYSLSGGERRRVEITRLLVTEPVSSCWTSPSPASTPWPWPTCKTSSASSKTAASASSSPTTTCARRSASATGPNPHRRRRNPRAWNAGRSRKPACRACTSGESFRLH